MLFVTLGLLLGAAALLWCFVLALTLADDDSMEGTSFDKRLSDHGTRPPLLLHLHDGNPTPHS